MTDQEKIKVLDCKASDNEYLHKDFHGALCYAIKYLDSTRDSFIQLAGLGVLLSLLVLHGEPDAKHLRVVLFVAQYSLVEHC